MNRPRQLYRVEFMQGHGWPQCTRREETKRTYETHDDAARMVTEIQRLPDHHALLGVWRSETEWREVTDEFVSAS